MKNNNWIRLGKVLIVIFSLILFMNALAAFMEIKRDLTYGNRAYGLSSMDDHFENGEYYAIYTDTVKNSIADEEPAVDVSQYEAFGRFYHAYMMARIDDDPIYRQQMAEEKTKISWKKILTVVDRLKRELNESKD